MAKYKTLEEVTIDGVGVGAGNEVELTEEQAAALEGKVEAVAEEAPAAPEAGEGGASAPEAGAGDQG